LVYTSFGGIKAVIWTDCIQAVVFISAGIGAFWWLTAEIGTAPLLESAAASGHLQLWQWKPQDSAWWNDSNWLVTAVLFGFISTVAAFSTDQDMVQRLLASRSSGMARRSLILSGFVALPVAALFLALGVALFVWFQLHPDAAFPLREVNGAMLPDADKVMAFFMTTPIPGWLRGLLLAGLLAAAMSSLDSAMAAMSASATRDIIAPLQRVQWSAQQWLLSSRLLTAAFAAALMFIAWILRDAAGFLWLAFKITSLTYGSLLGVFLLGRFSQRGTDRGNVRAMLIATALTSSALWLIETGRLPVAWTWLLVFGTVVTFSLAWLSGAKSTTYRIN
jgi:Na+/proline symporter